MILWACCSPLIAPGLHPMYAEPRDLMVDVETPSGELLAIDHPALLRMLGAGSGRATPLHCWTSASYSFWSSIHSVMHAIPYQPSADGKRKEEV